MGQVGNSCFEEKMSGKMASGQTKEVRRELYRYLWKSTAGKWISHHADPMQECACSAY